MKLVECYDTLNVSPSSRWEEIKKSYHFLARKYHPDAHPDRPGFESKFKKISQAFKILETSYRTGNATGKFGNGPNSSPFNVRKSAASKQKGPWKSAPEKVSPIRLNKDKKSTSEKKEGFSSRWSHFGQALFKLEKSIFLLDMKKNIYLKKRLVNQANIVRVKKGKDSFQVRIPPGPWTRMFIRVPNKGNRSLFSKKRGDLLLNIKVPSCNELTPKNPKFHYKVRIPKESLGTSKVWTLKSANGPIRFTLPRDTEDGQKFTLKASASKDAANTSHIITVQLV